MFSKRATALALAMAVSSAPALAASVTGRVVSQERTALPPGYVLRVDLRDISRQDAPSEEIAAIELRPKRQLPVSYALRYDPGRIDPSHMYSVSARILVGGRLEYISTRITSVITRGAAHRADILLQRVRGASR